MEVQVDPVVPGDNVAQMVRGGKTGQKLAMLFSTSGETRESLNVSGTVSLVAELGGNRTEEVLFVNCRGGNGGFGGRGGDGGVGGHWWSMVDMVLDGQ